MTTDFLIYVVVGFAAQTIDGAMGMAYGVTATTLLLSFGLSPAAASATVHAAECVSSGVSALSHRAFGNINRMLFRRLVVPGALGAVAGALVLSHFPSDRFRPFMAGYLLLMGGTIVFKAFRRFPPRQITSHLAPLGLFGGFVDAAGGGGWGPIVATTLIARGSEVRLAIGSTSAVEFFVSLAASVAFVSMLGFGEWRIVVGLALGGALGAPVGAWACRRLPSKTLMVLVGALVIALSLRALLV